MTEPTDAPSPSPALPSDAPPDKAKKKRDKVRGAWISFVGRIVAQIIGAAASVVLGVFVLQRMQSQQQPAPENRPAPARAIAPRANGEIALAVLPLDNFSADPQEEYFADGMTEALTANLAQIEGLHVISRTSAMPYKGRPTSLPQIAEELGVDLIVEGSVTRDGDRVRVTAQLIEARTDKHLWARSYDRTMRDILTLQSEVAIAIAKEVKGALPAQAAAPAVRRAVDPVVYDLYLRGRHAWNLRTPEGFESAIGYFTEATRRDPEFALGYAGLADAYSLRTGPMATNTRGENATRARAAAERALQLDDRLAEAHAALGGILFFTERDHEAAEREFQRALAINPHYATAHQWYGIALAEMGRDREALEHANEAVTQDPLSGTIRQALGLVHYYAQRYPESIAASRRALELNPQLPLARNVLAKAQILSGDPRAAIETLQSAAAASPESAMLTGVAYARSGDRAAADRIFRQLAARRPPPLSVLTQWHAALGDRDASYRMALRSADGPTHLLAIDPLFAPVRDDARLMKIARQRPAR